MRALRLTVIAAVVFTVAAVSGRAYAYFTAPATGSGHATIISTIDVTLTTDGLVGPTQKLYPGATKTLTATVDNSNTFAVVLDSVAIGTVLSASETACPGANLTASPPSVLSATPIPRSGTATVPITVSLNAGAPSGCQGVLFTIPVSVKVKVVAA